MVSMLGKADEKNDGVEGYVIQELIFSKEDIDQMRGIPSQRNPR